MSIIFISEDPCGIAPSGDSKTENFILGDEDGGESFGMVMRFYPPPHGG
jgi:hypothetical protein